MEKLDCKIPPGQTLLFAEPTFGVPARVIASRSFLHVPKGTEEVALNLAESGLLSDTALIAQRLKDEYIDMVIALYRQGIPFRWVASHREELDANLAINMTMQLGIRGIDIHPSISCSLFPRDWLVDLDGQLFINPDANFYFPEREAEHSPLGEGGNVLKLGKKVVVSHHDSFDDYGLRRGYAASVWRIKQDYEVGILPPPCGVDMDLRRHICTDFKSTHMDRVASLIKGDRGEEYLLADTHYLRESKPPWESYGRIVNAECRRLGVEVVPIDCTEDDVPYALNLVQFYDGSIFLSKGHNQLLRILKELVGEDKVFTTENPVVLYPLLLNGGIRCMTLFAPEYFATSRDG